MSFWHVMPLVALASVFAAQGGCTGAPAGAPAEVRVALAATTLRTSDPANYVMRGTRLGAIRREGSSPITLSSVPAAHARDSFIAALKSGARPAVGDEVRVMLPAPDEGLRNALIEIVFFDDLNGNERWDEGEAWVSAWNGSRGSYYVTYLTAARADLPGSHEGWNLCEGGEPPDCTGPLDRAVIHVAALNEPVVTR
jgi:hypothetical protein